VRPNVAGSHAQALLTARRESAAAIGFVAAIGALGGYVIPRALGASLNATGGVTTAILCFEAFYVACSAITWFYYLRRSFLTGLLPSLADADC
jgi:NNP family nitrate/nitrite transporter-like MFS transporter